MSNLDIIQKPQFKFVLDLRYIEIVEQYQQTLRNAFKDHAAQYMPSKRQENVRQASESMCTALQEFIDAFTSEQQAKMQAVKDRYSKPAESNYSDPQAEMLRRQDFQAWLSNLSDLDLKDYASQQSDQQDQLTAFQRATISNELRKRLNSSSGETRSEYQNFLSQGYFATSLKRYEDDQEYIDAKLSLTSIAAIRPQKKATTLTIIVPQATDDQGPFEWVTFEHLDTAAAMGDVPPLKELDELLTKATDFMRGKAAK